MCWLIIVDSCNKPHGLFRTLRKNVKLIDRNFILSPFKNGVRTFVVYWLRLRLRYLLPSYYFSVHLALNFQVSTGCLYVLFPVASLANVLDRLNNIERTVQIMKLLIMQFFFSLVLLPVRSKCYAQRHILQHTRSVTINMQRGQVFLVSELVVHTTATVRYYCCPNMAWIFVTLSSNIIVSFTIT